MPALARRRSRIFPLLGLVVLLGFACVALRLDRHWSGKPAVSPPKNRFEFPSVMTSAPDARAVSQSPRIPVFDPALTLTSLGHPTFHPNGKENTEVASGSQLRKPPLPATTQLVQGHVLFERNDGQADSTVLYLSRGPGYSLFLTRTGATIVLPEPKNRSHLTTRRERFFRLHFGGANPQTEVTGIETLPGTSNYFSGSDPKLWHTRIPQFARVRYSNLYSGVDLIFYFREGQLEYDVIVSPGADPSVVNIHAEGASTSLTGEGDVSIKMDANELVRLRKPYAYQSGTAPTVVPTSYSLHHGKLSFALGNYDRSQPLVIDPALIFSTFITSNCGTCSDDLEDMAADNTGVYLTGSTDAAIFPATANGPASSAPQGLQTFIVKLDPTGSHILYSTFLNNSTGQAIAVDASGSAYVSGNTSRGTPAFPLTQGVFSGTVPPNAAGSVAYAVKLSPDGSTILYSTLLQQPTPGGTPVNPYQIVNPTKVAVDSTGALYVGGVATPSLAIAEASSSWMPLPVTLGAYQTTPGSAFVLKLNPNASGLAYSTYIDGASDPNGSVVGIAVDSTGNAFVAGATGGDAFPTTSGAYQTSNPANPQYGTGFVVELNPNGAAPVYSTYFGTVGETNTVPSGMALDSHGQAVITGYSSGVLPVTSNAFCGNFAPPPAPEQGFVAKFTADGSALVYATTLCGSDSDAPSVAVDSTGAAYVVGITFDPASFQSILLQPIQGYPPGGNPATAYVALKLDTSGALQWSTFLGTNIYLFDPSHSKITVDGNDSAYIVGFPGLPSTPNSIGPPFLAPGQGPNDTETGNFLLKIAPSLGAPVPLISPSQVSFTNQNVGTDSASSDVQVGNFGDAPMSPGISITGDFSETDNCSVAVPGGQKCDINVVFKPSVTGPRTGTLTVGFGGTIPSQTVSLSGNAGAPTITLSPTSLSFPVQATGTTSGAQQITISNSGTGPLTILSLQTSGPFATTNTCGAPVSPANDCTVQVTFAPTASGTQTGTLTISDNAANSPQTVALTGNVGTSTGPSVILSPTSLSFGNQATGTTSTAQQVKVTNSGNAPLTISSVQTTSQFTSANACSGPVAPASSCTIQVTFTPSASGAQTGTLTISDNASNNPQTVALMGTGTTGPPSSIGLGIPSGGSASATINAGATASYALAIGGAGMTGTASFTCTGAPKGAICSVPATLPINATTASTLNVSVTTTSRSLLLFLPSDSTLWLWALAILGCLALFWSASSELFASPRWRFAPLLALALCACGGGSSSSPPPANPNGTPAGAYTIVVTAKSGTTTQTQNLTLTVQ